VFVDSLPQANSSGPNNNFAPAFVSIFTPHGSCVAAASICPCKNRAAVSAGACLLLQSLIYIPLSAH